MKQAASSEETGDTKLASRLKLKIGLPGLGWLSCAGSLLTSVVVHLVLFLILAVWTFGNNLVSSFIQIQSFQSDAEQDKQLEMIDIDVAKLEIATTNTEQFQFSQTRINQNSTEVKFDTEVVAVEPTLPTSFDELLSQPKAFFGANLPKDKWNLSETRAQLREAANEEDAVDGIASEILAKRRKGDLLTIWLFDASLSLRENRKQAAKRMGVVFGEIEKRIGSSSYRSKNAVVAFGSVANLRVEPTKSSRKVTRAIRDMPEDPSGKENVLSSLVWSVKRFRQDWEGNILVVIWTDESGDDLEFLEETIAFCQASNVSVSVIGPTAVFGFELGTHLFYYKPLKRSFYLPINRGPESALKQRINLSHWRNVGWGKDEWVSEPVSSGFAPYSLMRLTRETNGSYTIFDRAGDRGQFRLEAIRDYIPDYRSKAEIESDLSNYPLRRAVVDAVRVTYQQKERSPLRMTFFKIWSNPAKFRDRLDEALTRETEYAQYMANLSAQALVSLSTPEVESAYNQDPSLRWKASYDLARGRLLRMNVRYNEYIATCRMLRLRNSTNLLSFHPSRRLRIDLSKQRLAEAEHFLNRCIEKYEETPWSFLAKKELQTSLGFVDRQRNQAVPNTSSGRGGGGSVSLPKL